MPTLPSLTFERYYRRRGFQFIAGIDEVGRGSWAGPVVAAAVILPKSFKLDGLNDSKKLTYSKREELAKIIKEESVSLAIAQIEVNVIDKKGVGQATFMAFRKAIKHLEKKPDFILVDAFYVPYLINKNFQLGIVKGDQKSSSIAAASIVAKVYRDHLMERLSLTYPLYGFEKHKGYGTSSHQAAIRQWGLTPVHRSSFNIKVVVK